MGDRSDDELARAAASGDAQALDELLARHVDRVHGVCARVLRDPQDALDATQNALIAIARGIDRFDGRAAFTTWMYRVATNAALDEGRRSSRRPTPVDELPNAVDGRSGTEATVSASIDVHAALAQLPDEFRVAVVLRDLEDLDYAEIAAILDIPPGTVRSRIARGRTALAAILTDRSAGNSDPVTERPIG
ncbi:MAG: putative polymerase subfamily sigma factor [Actinomycetia bacterium]|nr:putative polymerase subfamily sigma factor [Actinomycetes bacterium]